MRVGKHTVEVRRNAKGVMTEVVDIRFEEIVVLGLPPAGVVVAPAAKPKSDEKGKGGRGFRIPVWVGPVVMAGVVVPLVVGLLAAFDMLYIGPMVIASPSKCEPFAVKSGGGSSFNSKANPLNTCGSLWRVTARKETDLKPAAGGPGGAGRGRSRDGGRPGPWWHAAGGEPARTHAGIGRNQARHRGRGASREGRMKIYTRTGDAGETGLFGGPRVSKDDIRVAAYGEIDEANATLGVALALCADPELSAIIRPIQVELFDVGAVLATPPESLAKLSRRMDSPVDAARIRELESVMDRLDTELQPLTTFILPGGTALSAALHVCRTTLRRAERAMVTLHRHSPVEPLLLTYVNRLSDLFFLLARVANVRAGVPEPLWQPKRKVHAQG
jgi:cob(I)alamin adenosyltransferase